ncbi:MAG: type Z 30S ribosomal protein S14 [Planctomycetes bacterium]|nr:type Z 30S ribosomal protein S14 [Planctomycetota bacterium]
MAKTCLIMKSRRTPKFSVRQHNRCKICGRSRAYYRKFGICRLCLRMLAHRGEVPGLMKASW